MPPMWSRCPCVMITARTRSLFFSRYEVVGTRRILFFFEVETRVHYDNVAIYINSDHIAADLFNAAQWNDAHDIFCREFWLIIGAAFSARTSNARAAEYSLYAAGSASQARA